MANRKSKICSKTDIFEHFFEMYTKSHIKNKMENYKNFRAKFFHFMRKSLKNTKYFCPKNLASLYSPLVGFDENRCFQSFWFFDLNLLHKKFLAFWKFFKKSKNFEKNFRFWKNFPKFGKIYFLSGRFSLKILKNVKYWLNKILQKSKKIFQKNKNFFKKSEKIFY